MEVIVKDENKYDDEQQITTSSKQREQIIKEVHRLEILPVLIDILSSFSANKVNVKDLDNEFGTIRVRLGKLKEVLQSVEGLGIPMAEKTKNLGTVEDLIRCKLDILESVRIHLKEKINREVEKHEPEDQIENSREKEEGDKDVVMTVENDNIATHSKNISRRMRKPVPLITGVRSLMVDKENKDLLKIYNEVTQKANMAMESSLQSQITTSDGNSNGLLYEANSNSANNKGNSEDNANIQSGDNDNLQILNDEELMDLDQLNDGLLMMQDGEDISAVLDTMGDAPATHMDGLDNNNNMFDSNNNQITNNNNQITNTSNNKNDNSSAENKKDIGEGNVGENDLDFFSKDFFLGSDEKNNNKAISGSGITSTDQAQNFFNGGSINLSDFNLNSELLGATGDGVTGGAGDILLTDTAVDSALKFAGFSADNSNGENKDAKNAFTDLNDFGFNMEF